MTLAGARGDISVSQVRQSLACFVSPVKHHVLPEKRQPMDAIRIELYLKKSKNDAQGMGIREARQTSRHQPSDVIPSGEQEDSGPRDVQQDMQVAETRRSFFGLPRHLSPHQPHLFASRRVRLS